MSCTIDLKLTTNFRKTQFSKTFAGKNFGETLTPQQKATVS